MPAKEKDPDVRIGTLAIKIPITIELGKADKLALITGGVLLVTEVLKLLQVIKLPLQEEKNVTLIIPTETQDVTVTIPMDAGKAT